MKNKFTLTVAILLLAAMLTLSLVGCGVEPVEIGVAAWDNVEFSTHDFVLDDLYIYGEVEYLQRTVTFTPRDENDVKNVALNNKYFVMQKKLDDSKDDTGNYMFVKDDNIYMLKKTVDGKSFELRNLSSYYIDKSVRLNFASPCGLPSFSKEEYDNYLKELSLNIFDFVFKYWDYNECKELYSHFTYKNVEFNDEEGLIKIRAYDYDELSKDYFVVLNFEEKKIGMIDGSSEIIYF